MSLRTMRSAQMGWSMYKATDPRASIEAINLALGGQDLPPISARMYDHYGRLERHGFTHYVPINELDMWVKGHRKAS
jgi:hypothetical protein